MISRETAKSLQVGDKIHHSLWTLGGKCEVWTVEEQLRLADIGLRRRAWGVLLKSPDGYGSAALCRNRMKEWHLPVDCPLEVANA